MAWSRCPRVPCCRTMRLAACLWHKHVWQGHATETAPETVATANFEGASWSRSRITAERCGILSPDAACNTTGRYLVSDNGGSITCRECQNGDWSKSRPISAMLSQNSLKRKHKRGNFTSSKMKRIYETHRGIQTSALASVRKSIALSTRRALRTARKPNSCDQSRIGN